MSGRTRSVVLAGACSLAVAVAVVAGAGSAGQPAGAAEVAVPLATTVDPADAQTFAVLDRAVSMQDAVPAVEDDGLTGGSFTQDFGANLGLARAVAGLPAGAAWVVPGNGSVCLIADASYGSTAAPDGGAMCSADATAAGGYLEFTTGHMGTDSSVAGLVPNGVDAVQIQLADGSQQSVAVHDNVYLASLSEDLVAVSFTLPDGQAVEVTN